MKNLKFFPILLATYEMLVYLSNDIYLPALPTIARTFHVNSSMAQLTMTAWLLGGASMQLILGPVSDRYGRRPILLGGGLLFIFATFLCAISPNITIFFVARFLQGCTICSIIVSGYACIHELFDQKKAMRTLATMMSITVVAPAFGPLLGGFLFGIFGWRFLFYFLGGCAIVILMLLFKQMPESHPAEERQAISLSKTSSNYKAVITNPKFICKVLVIGVVNSGVIAWIATGSFIVVEKFGYAPLFFGVFQAIVFGGFILGGRFVKYTVKHMEGSSLAMIGVIIVMISAAGLVLVAYLKPSQIGYFISCLTGLTFGNALIMGPLQRLALESVQKVPMGTRMAVISSFGSASGVLGSLLAATFYTGTLSSLAWVILATSFVGGGLYLTYRYILHKL